MSLIDVWPLDPEDINPIVSSDLSIDSEEEVESLCFPFGFEEIKVEGKGKGEGESPPSDGTWCVLV